jgi:sugar O-acyltransferase (sialic acid O-acetyltransferase NeuD family)
MLYLIGAGGHCKVVIDALRKGGLSPSVIKVRDGNSARTGEAFMGFLIETPDVDAELGSELFHLTIGDCAMRAQRHREIVAIGGAPHTIIHPSATIANAAQIGAGCFVACGAVVAPDATVGASTIVNHNAVVDHDCVIGDFCHIAPSATLGGGVNIGDRVLVGSGAVIMPGLVIGEGSVIGAGAVVTRSVGPNQIWVGNPACEQVKL